MSKILFTVLVIFITVESSLGKAKLDWWEGSVILNSGEALIGHISYNSTFDIVSVIKDNEEGIKTFSPIKVASFQYFDDEYEMMRKFVSLDYVHPSTYKCKLFFEEVLIGKIMLVRRELTLKQFYSLSPQAIDENFGGHAYYVYNGKSFINLKRFKKQILPLLVKEYKVEMDDFIKEKKVKMRNKENQLMLVDYYNFLSDEKRKHMKYMFSLN